MAKLYPFLSLDCARVEGEGAQSGNLACSDFPLLNLRKETAWLMTRETNPPEETVCKQIPEGGIWTRTLVRLIFCCPTPLDLALALGF